VKQLEVKVPPVAQFLVAAGLMWLLAFLVPDATVRFPGQLLAASLVLLVAGLVGMAGVRAFARAQTTVNPLRPEAASRLVTGGIYRHTRNPMYLALLLALLAWGLWLGHLLAWLGIPAFALAMTACRSGPRNGRWRRCSAMNSAPTPGRYAAGSERHARPGGQASCAVQTLAQHGAL
jgi:protein-S-isoprenylcysteine O-methyltransferase Ste14